MKSKLKELLLRQGNGLVLSALGGDGWTIERVRLKGGFLPHYLAVRCYGNLGIVESQQLNILWKCPYESKFSLSYFLVNYIIMYSLVWMERSISPGVASKLKNKRVDNVSPVGGFACQTKVREWLEKMSTKYLEWLWNASYGSADVGNGTSPIEHVHSTTRGILSRQRSVGLDTVLKIITMALLQRTTNHLYTLPPIPTWHSNKAMKQITLRAARRTMELWSADRKIMENCVGVPEERMVFFPFFPGVARDALHFVS